MRYDFSVGFGIAMLAGILASGVTAQEPNVVEAEPNAVSDDVRVDACASDSSLLGLSRIVEIDTKGGPQFGGKHSGATDFLKDREVVLTFDDGPMRSHTRQILKALDGQCTKATFFMVGRMAAADPAMVKEVARAGHTVASHTWSHQNLTALGLIKGRQEFEMGLAAVSKALGEPAAAFFRFPYLGANGAVERHIQSRDVSSIWVDVDSKDYQTRDPKLVHNRIMSELARKRKGIILMHDIQPSTANAIKGLLAALRDKGYKIVHIVPRAPSSAVATYDGTIDETFAEKSAAAAANPLADRSVVWTMSPGKARVGKPSGRTTSPVRPVATGTPKAIDELPWLQQPSTPPPPPRAVVKPRKPAREPVDNLPWGANIFGY